MNLLRLALKAYDTLAEWTYTIFSLLSSLFLVLCMLLAPIVLWVGFVLVIVWLLSWLGWLQYTITVSPK